MDGSMGKRDAKCDDTSTQC
uniref:Uncharacterized protein n=1 Tax=Rhizophora mucronata TaxID=61149 RepID=A0A2P2ISN1_RHIMU